MDITIREALPGQAADLSDIALKAKGYWGYSGEQIELWKKEILTVLPLRRQVVDVTVCNKPIKQ